jgi:hypothetical protein
LEDAAVGGRDLVVGASGCDEHTVGDGNGEPGAVVVPRAEVSSTPGFALGDGKNAEMWLERRKHPACLGDGNPVHTISHVESFRQVDRGHTRVAAFQELTHLRQSGLAAEKRDDGIRVEENHEPMP